MAAPEDYGNCAFMSGYSGSVEFGYVFKKKKINDFFELKNEKDIIFEPKTCLKYLKFMQLMCSLIAVHRNVPLISRYFETARSESFEYSLLGQTRVLILIELQ